MKNKDVSVGEEEEPEKKAKNLIKSKKLYTLD